MQITTRQILKLLYILSWIIFVGVCIEAGGFIVNGIATLLLTPAGAKHFWQEVDLSTLYTYDKGYFSVITLMMSMVAVMRAILFYLIIKILHNKLDMSQPFSTEIGRFIFKISYLAFLIGLFSTWGVNYAGWLMKQGVTMPDVRALRLDGGDVWLFMSVTLYVIAQMFKRGIEIQKENELTV